MILTDTHTHLYLKEFDADRDLVIQKAIESNIKRFFLPNIDSSTISDLIALVEKYPENCFAMMGLHPCSVKENYREELEIIEKLILEKRKLFYAVGEIGIDLYWDKTFLKEQQHAFNYQISIAKQQNLPIVIHSRNSFEEVYSIVKDSQDGNLRGVFHCFSGNKAQAIKIIELKGFKLGIGGVVTFKNSGLDEVVKNIDMKHIILETDSPYLAPVPYRGKRNESVYLYLILKKIAELKGMSVEEVAEVTTNNSIELFDI